MAYIDIEFYNSIYGEGSIQETVFGRLLWKAERFIDRETTGVDGVAKLREHFPTDEMVAETVKRCVAELVNVCKAIEEASSVATTQYEETANGLRPKVISSISAGNESISYVTQQTPTTISNALADKGAQDKLLRDTVVSYLSGCTDSNGVNLLFMGVYPRRYV